MFTSPTLPRQRAAEVILQPCAQAYVLEEKNTDMRVHIVNTTNGLSFFALTILDRHIDAEPGSREEVFSIASLTAYRNDTGVHIVRVKDGSCPGGYPDRSLLGFCISDGICVVEFLFCKITLT